VRFDQEGTQAEISVTVNPEEWGNGYGTELILKGCKKYFEEKPEIEKIVAEVLKGNDISIRIFEKAKFRKVEELKEGFKFWLTKMREFTIGNKKIGEGSPTFIIAEISGNHNQDYDTAKKLVRAACEAGADAIKLQTYTPDTITIDSDKKWFQVEVNDAWKNRTLYELYKIAYTPWNWQPKLKKIAEGYGIPLFSTPFDKTAVDFLEEMTVEFYKIASFEIGDLELLKKVAYTKKPVIMSRGMSSLKELELAYKTLKENGCPQVAILHCVSSYPAKPEEMNLSTIPFLKETFPDAIIGLSDHTVTTETAVASVALGAKIIEKHIILDRTLGGVDSAFSLEPEEFKELIRQVRNVEKSIGKPHLKCGEGEQENSIFKRSLFIVENIREGEIFTNKNIRSIRPGYGLQPKYFNTILGKKAKINIEKATPLTWNLIELS